MSRGPWGQYVPIHAQHPAGPDSINAGTRPGAPPGQGRGPSPSRPTSSSYAYAAPSGSAVIGGAAGSSYRLPNYSQPPPRPQGARPTSTGSNYRNSYSSQQQAYAYGGAVASGSGYGGYAAGRPSVDSLASAGSAGSHSSRESLDGQQALLDSARPPAGAAAAAAVAASGGGRRRYADSHIAKSREAAQNRWSTGTSSSYFHDDRSSNTNHSSKRPFSVPQNYASGPIKLEPEEDDYLHDPKKDRGTCTVFSLRGILNVAALVFLVCALMFLFAGYPILSGLGILSHKSVKMGLNGTSQIPDLPLPQLVDPKSPSNAQSWTSPDGVKFNLVFSDEFETDGRTFGAGEDPYWEAVDLWYSGTFDYEWYSPENIMTQDGKLVITMEEKESHNLNFQSGMLQSWNKTCFQGGYIEISTLLPGAPTAQGYWPGLWLMGNLGRPGYPGSTDGMWPYSYSSCDTGILPNQTRVDGSGPEGAIKSKGQYAAPNGQVSFLPGMRSPSCTCDGEDHPGPSVNTARSAPELDILEAQVVPRGAPTKGQASQSLQTAPFDDAYHWGQGANQATIYNSSLTSFNDYQGGPYQEAVSSLTDIPGDGYDLAGQRFVKFGLEYEPDWNLNGGGYARWYVDGKPSWQIKGSAIGPQPEMEIGQRHIPVEPMSIIINLAMADGFEPALWDTLTFPARLQIDYVRVYQKAGQSPRLSCDPPDYPTAKYINDHPDLYRNPNLTTYKSSGRDWPKNTLSGC